MQGTQVIPFSVMIARSTPFSDAANQMGGHYSKGGDPFFRTTGSPNMNRASFLELTEDIYCELISITDVKDAQMFLDAHPYLRFAYHRQSDAAGLRLEDSETLDSYCEIMVKAVAQYNDVRRFLNLKQQYKKDPAPEIRSEMMQIYGRNFTLLEAKSEHWSSPYEMEEHYFDQYNVVDAVVEQMMEDHGPCAPSKSERMDAYFDGNEAKRAEHEAAVWARVHSIVDHKMFDDVERFVSGIVAMAPASYNQAAERLEYLCPDLLPAMYMMTYVSIHNAYTYKLCAHKNCHQYFRVDPSHPQTLCEKHIAVRRRKRENYRKYKNDPYYSKNQ